MWLITTTTDARIRLRDNQASPTPRGIGVVQADGTPWAFIPRDKIADVEHDADVAHCAR